MKFLHTSDFHLGRAFCKISLKEDHQVILKQILEAIDKYKPDALLISGDIFDRTVPPDTALKQFTDFLCAVHTRKIPTAFMAGNHDSPEKIEAFSLYSGEGVLIRGRPECEPKPLILKDTHGDVAISVLPFTYEYAAQQCFDNTELKTTAEVMTAQVEAARPMVPKGARWVILAHTFVVGGKSSESERLLGRVVGGSETVPSDVFDGASYVALGHLHRPQSVSSERIQYSGSPLAFGFDEAEQKKSMTIVEIDGNRVVTSEKILFRPKRRLITLRGFFRDLLERAKHSDDFIKIVLLDPVTVIDPMRRLRKFYPHACTLDYERHEASKNRPDADLADGTTENPIELMTGFMINVRDGEVSEGERDLIEKTLNSVNQDEQFDSEDAG